MKTCSIDGCDSPAKTKVRSWCSKHDTRWKRTGDPLGTKIAPKGSWVGAVCSVEGCGKVVRARGWCVAHYSQWEKHGDPLVRHGTPAGTWAGKACAVADCGEPATEHGMCARHRKRVKKHGDPTVGARETLAPDAPAVVYVVRHPHLGAGKVGIGDPDGRRVREHVKRGWSVVWLSDTMTRAEARQVERALLSLPPALGVLGSDDMPQGGWTETFDEQWLARLLEVC